MNFEKKSSYIREAQKNQISENDIPDKFKVIKILKENGLTGLTDMLLIFHKDSSQFIGAFNHSNLKGKMYKFHRPDVWVNAKDLVIEIDGYGIHGEDEYASEQTIERNKLYLKSGLKLIVLQKESLKLQNISWNNYLKYCLEEMGLIKQ